MASIENFTSFDAIVKYFFDLYPIAFYNFTISLNKKEEILPLLTEFCKEHNYELRVRHYGSSTKIRTQLKK